MSAVKADYRVARVRDANDEWDYGIYEVFYKENGEMDRFSILPVEPSGQTLEELKEDFTEMIKAFDKPLCEVYESDVEDETENIREVK